MKRPRTESGLLASKFRADRAFKFAEIEPLLHACRFGEARDVISKVLDRDPKNYAAWRLLHETYCGTRAFAQALDAIEHAVALRPDNAYYRKLYAICLKDNGEYRAATPLLEALHHDNPHDLKVMDALKVCYFRLGNMVAARTFGEMRLLAMASSVRSKGALPPMPAPAAPSGYRVAAFAVWGHRSRYCLGAMANARLVRALLPRWKARFYVGSDVPTQVVDDLTTEGAEIVREGDIPKSVPNYMWRFLVADDMTIERFICRDTDSRLSPKDVAAVGDWVQSKYRYHIMRDHIFHNDLILAGLWGGMPDRALQMMDLIRAFQSKNADDRRYGVDQAFLRECVWPLIRERVLTHDSYYSIGESRPFPLGRKGDDLDHVGIGVPGRRGWPRAKPLPMINTFKGS